MSENKNASKTEINSAEDNNNSQPSETVVIAEDSIPNQKILQHLLIKLGYNVIACNNGQEAWNEINKPENTKIVAVLTDMMMPEMGGMDLLKMCRESEKFKAIPIVLITAVSDKDQIIAAKKLNVNGYILKPVTFQRVTAKLQELFPNKKFPNVAA